MKNLTILLCVLCLSFAFAIHAQNEQKSSLDKVSIGFGYGQDYGGFGANLMYYPQKYFGFFGGAGWAYAGLGLNAGVKFRYAKDIENSMANGYLLAMYGYNAAISVKDATQYNKFFYGLSVGAGLNLRLSSHNFNSLTFAVIYPFRTSAVNDYVNDLKNKKRVTFDNVLLPVTFSIGIIVPFKRN